MGGKNAIIVDTSADLDEAVLGIRLSAFGFQGQKCSACSRIIVVDPAGPQGPAINLFTERFVESTRSYIVKNPLHPGADMGPVIDEEAAAKIRHYIKIAQDEGATMLLGDGGAGILPASTSPERKLGVPSSPALAGEVSVKSATLTEGARSPSDQPGTAGAGDPPSDPSVASSLRRSVAPQNYIPPHIFTNVTPDHTIAREEIFGPVVAIMHAPTFDDALAIANAVPYKLTGAVFTRKPAHIDRAKSRFRVGNLYINRPCTGALVARQPFGGFAMSGVGSKAGGSEYLHQFVEPRACCENTMRRGFAPEL
jgi:acyl-CoA reductase-like NAD-dependent aldehyde dehydrogenase